VEVTVICAFELGPNATAMRSTRIRLLNWGVIFIIMTILKRSVLTKKNQLEK
jgi:hypothetical protein